MAQNYARNTVGTHLLHAKWKQGGCLDKKAGLGNTKVYKKSGHAKGVSTFCFSSIFRSSQQVVYRHVENIGEFDQVGSGGFAAVCFPIANYRLAGM